MNDPRNKHLATIVIMLIIIDIAITILATIMETASNTEIIIYAVLVLVPLLIAWWQWKKATKQGPPMLSIALLSAIYAVPVLKVTPSWDVTLVGILLMSIIGIAFFYWLKSQKK